MKKKGRVIGTIGWILSFAMVGGVLVYGAMFDDNTVGQTVKPIGASTGNIVNALTKGEGLDETKALLSDTAESLFATPATDAEYSSYTLKMTTKSSGKVENAIVYVNTDYVIYSDASYTYVRVGAEYYSGRTTEKETMEFAFVKETNELWVLSADADGGAIGTGDSAYLGKAEWSKGDVGVIGVGNPLTPVAMAFQTIDAAELSLTSGMFTYENKVDEANKAVFNFTLGYSPVISYSGTVESGDVYYSLAYSNLNNTKVNLPSSLKTAMSKEA